MDRTLVTVTLVCAFVAGCQATVQVVAPSGGTEVEQHTEIKLVCRVPADASDVTWQRDGADIAADPARQITIEFSSVQSGATRDNILRIAEAEETDAGEYKCTADGDESHNGIHITVEESEHHVTALASQVTLTLGSVLTLTCEADMHTEVTWYRGEQAIVVDDVVKVVETVDEDEHIKTSKLIIGNVTDAHLGNYFCKNGHHGDDMAEISVVLSASVHFIGNWWSLLIGSAASLYFLSR